MADKTLRSEQIEDLATSKITSGTFADARIAESNVTQHEAALSITESQISDLGSYQTLDAQLTSLAGLTPGAEGRFVESDGLGGFQMKTLADAGALMDSEVTNLAQVKAFDSTDYATAAQGSTADSAMQNLVEDTSPQLGGTLDANGNAFGDATEVDNGNSGTADTIDWGAGNFQKSTMTGNCTFTFTAPSVKGRFQLMLVQDGTGSRTATWPAAVKWPGGTAPTLSTAASSIDIITFYYDGTNYYGVETLDFQ